MTKNSRPLIGIIPDYQDGSPDSYSVKNHYALRTNYIEAINKAGGIAIVLGYDYELIDSYLELIDGLMIIGGDFDIHPKYYNEKPHPLTKINEIRQEFEYQLASKAIVTEIPFFGICNGIQLLNILYGGSAIQHIPDEKKFINHEQKYTEGFNDPAKAYHEVKIEKNSKLFDIAGIQTIKTNSTHHQAIREVGTNLTISAKASDGIIEAVENNNHPFCIGVQWHPEYKTSSADKKIFESFVDAAKNYKNSK